MEGIPTGSFSKLGPSAGEEEQDLRSNNGLLEGFGMHMLQRQRGQERIFHQCRISGCEIWRRRRDVAGDHS